MVDNAEFRHRIPEEDAGHTCIPNAVLLDPRIAPMTRLCYSVVKSYAYGNKQNAYPGQKALAEQLGVKDRMVRYYLSELEVLGLITIEQRGLGLTNIYWIEPLAGLTERIPKYLEWLKARKDKRQSVAKLDRQPIASQVRKPVADPSGNGLPTKKSRTQKKTRKEEKKESSLPLSQQALANTEPDADTTALVVSGNGQSPTPLSPPSPPPAPHSHRWLFSSASDASMHLIEDRGKRTNIQQQHTLCGELVQHRVTFAAGLQCISRPCPDCEHIAREVNLLVYALQHVTGVDANLNSGVRELARDLQKGGYKAEDVAAYEGQVWRKVWPYIKNPVPSCKPTLQQLRDGIGAVKSDTAQSRYDPTYELTARIRELRRGEPIADRRVRYANDDDDHPALSAGDAPLLDVPGRGFVGVDEASREASA